MTEYERGFIDGIKSKVSAELTPTLINVSKTMLEMLKPVLSTALENALNDNNAITDTDVQPVNQWISVDERLPKPFEKVLCYCISTSGDIDAYMIGCINKHWGLLKGETFVSEKETHRIVAYWQPLPPRPTIDYCRFCKKYGADMRGGTENDT